MEKIQLAMAYFTQSSTIVQKIVKADRRRRYLFFHCYTGNCSLALTDPPILLTYILTNEIFEPRVGLINDFYLWHPTLAGTLVVGYEANIPIS